MKNELSVKSTGNQVEIVETKAASGRVRRKAQLFLLKRLIETQGIVAASAYLRSFSAQFRSQENTRAARNSRYETKADGTDWLAERKPNHYLDKLLEVFNPENEKRPPAIDLGQWFGVEIECFIPYENLDADDWEHRDDCEDDSGDCSCHEDRSDSRTARKNLSLMFKRERISGVSLRGDGSIHAEDGCYPIEVTVLTRRGHLENLKAACALLNRLGAKVNKSCGLHVHLDCRDLWTVNGNELNKSKASRRARRLGNALELLAAMQPISRRSNSFCRLAVSSFKGDRYFAINKTSLRKHGTIEVRLHSSTTNFDKISNWAELLYQLSRRSSSGLVGNVGDLIAAVPNVSDAVLTYVEKRLAVFSGTEGEHTRASDSEDRSVVAA